MESKSRPYVLAETNWKTVKNNSYTVAILPWGATEAHNYHLPYATDNYQAEYVAVEAAKKAWGKNIKTIVLPTIPFGVNTGQMDITLCINMNPSTQYAVLKDIVHVLNKQGIQKLVIINSHGGNNFKQMIRELSLEYPRVFICSINWWQVATSKDFFHEPGDHAGELETSALLHIKPELVLPIDQAGNGSEKKFKIKGLKEGWATAQRDWSKISEDTGVGNPKKASKIKGERFLNTVIKSIAGFLEDLSKSDLNKMYE